MHLIKPSSTIIAKKILLKHLDTFVALSRDWIISAVLKYINFPIADRHLCRTGPLTLEP